MDLETLRKLIMSIILTLLNLILIKVLETQSSVMFSILLTLNTSFIIVLLIGMLSGLIGDVITFIVEFISLTMIYFIRVGINLNTLTYIILYYLIGVSITSSLFRKFRLNIPKVGIDFRVVSDLLLIIGSSLILLYLLWFTPIVNYLQLPQLLRGNLSITLFILGVSINSLLIVLTNEVRFNTLTSVLQYMMFSVITMFSWASTPIALAMSYGFVTYYEDYVVLGRVVKKIGSRGFPIKTFNKYVKIPIKHSENRHVVIVGMSGSGKSYLAKKMAKQLVRRSAVVIIDPHGEYVGLTRELNGKVLTPIENPINPLDTLGKPKNVRAEEVSDMLRRVFKLGNIQKYVLYNLILSTYERLGDLTPTFNDVFITLTNTIESSSPKDGFLSRDVLNSLIPYLDLLRSQYLTTTSIIPEELFSGLTVVDLSTVDSDFLRGIYVESLLYVVNTYMKSANKPLFLIVDEAHRFMGGKVAPLLSKLVMEGRKFGVTLVVITQHPLDLDPNIIGNSAYIVTFTIQEVNNLNYISRVLSSGYIRYEVIRNIITNLKSYEALVKVRDDKYLYVIKA